MLESNFGEHIKECRKHLTLIRLIRLDLRIFIENTRKF